MDSFERVASYYARFNEWDRLDSPAGRLEFLRTTELLRQHLAAGARVLDLGGGPGRYTAFLAEHGFRPWLADLSPVLIETAKIKLRELGIESKVEGISVANAVELGAFESASFDAVLCAGPFYHLTRQEDRLRAAQEATRVLKPGGLLFLGFMPRLSALAGLLVRAAKHPYQLSRGAFEAAIESGSFRNESDLGFQEGYFMALPEAEALLASTGLEIVSSQSLKGIAAGREEHLWKLYAERPDLFSAAYDALVRTCSARETIELGDHAVIIARRR